MAKLIMTAEQMKDRSEWLKQRNLGIGGSDAGIIVGVNYWQKPYGLWLEKTGQTEPADLSDNEAVYWGTVLEDAVATRFEEVTGKRVRKSGLLQSEEYPFMQASPDRMIVGESAGLEIKTASSYNRRAWDGDKVPDTYYCQCMHYLAVTGCDRWYIAALIGGQRFIWKCIERNEEEIQALIKAEKEFWQHVVDKTAPEVDSSATPYLLEKFPDATQKEVIDLPASAEALAKEYKSIGETMDQLEERQEDVKAKLLDLLGRNEAGQVGRYRVIWKNRKGSAHFDSQKFKEDYPELAAKYIKQNRSYRLFSIKEFEEDK